MHSHKRIVFGLLLLVLVMAAMPSLAAAAETKIVSAPATASAGTTFTMAARAEAGLVVAFKAVHLPKKDVVLSVSASPGSVSKGKADYSADIALPKGGDWLVTAYAARSAEDFEEDEEQNDSVIVSCDPLSYRILPKVIDASITYSSPGKVQARVLDMQGEACPNVQVQLCGIDYYGDLQVVKTYRTGSDGRATATITGKSDDDWTSWAWRVKATETSGSVISSVMKVTVRPAMSAAVGGGERTYGKLRLVKGRLYRFDFRSANEGFKATFVLTSPRGRPSFARH